VLFTLFGLYQEGTFNNKQFELFARALDRNYPRLINWYIENGYIKEVDIIPYAKKSNRSVTEAKLMGKMYKLTYMSNLMIQEIYRRLVMRMPIPENMMVHSLDKTHGHTNKRYRIENLVKGFNAKQMIVSEMNDNNRIEDDYLFMKKEIIKEKG
jgi:glycerol-3-phosphate dehydrogenase